MRRELLADCTHVARAACHPRRRSFVLAAGAKPATAGVKEPQKAGKQHSIAAVVDRARSRKERKAGSSPKRERVKEEANFDSSLVPTADLLRFERDGHLTTRSLLPGGLVQQLDEILEEVVEERRLEALRHRIRVLCPGLTSARTNSVKDAEATLRQHGSEPVGFLQVFNTWRQDEEVKRIICSPPLVEAAAALLGTRKVRLYQDCTFVKEPGFARTNWHSDLRMAPLDTNSFVTAWIPLRPMRAHSDSGLRFACGSHRDFALPFWRGGQLDNVDLSSRGYAVESTGAMELGDVSWHAGWTVHCGAAQPEGSPTRRALAVSFFADGARLLPRKLAAAVGSEDRESYAAWLKDLKDGGPAVHKLLPLLDLPRSTAIA